MKPTVYKLGSKKFFRENVVATCYTFRECNFGTYNLLLLRGVKQSLEMVRKAKIMFIKS